MVPEWVAEFRAWATLAVGAGTLIVAGFGVWVGYQGLQTWQAQLRGTDRYTLAKNILSIVFSIKDEVYEYRFRGPDFPRSFDRSPSPDKFWEKHKPRSERSYAKLQKLREELKKLRIEAEFQFGQELCKLASQLDDMIFDLFRAYMGIDHPLSQGIELTAYKKTNVLVFYAGEAKMQMEMISTSKNLWSRRRVYASANA